MNDIETRCKVANWVEGAQIYLITVMNLHDPEHVLHHQDLVFFNQVATFPSHQV